jgi:hypothetical protein
MAMTVGIDSAGSIERATTATADCWPYPGTLICNRLIQAAARPNDRPEQPARVLLAQSKDFLPGFCKRRFAAVDLHFMLRAYSTALTISSTTFLASPKTIMVLFM